jgi:hypothetical protein
VSFQASVRYVALMRALAAILIGFLAAAPSAGQWRLVTAPAPAPIATGWNPTADYIESGQDEPGYRAWIAAQPWRATAVSQFHAYLENSGVAFVSPTWQLLRTASDWRRCGAAPFEIPPADEWPNIVNTLRYVRDHVIPEVGPVEPVSVFRNAGLNRCAGGAPESVHRSMSAIDFVPLTPIDRNTMIHRLCAEHQAQGPRWNAGLGFYAKMRFHVDSWKYRTWGQDDSGHIACPKVAPLAPPPVTLAKAPEASGTPGLVFRTVPVASVSGTGVGVTTTKDLPTAPSIAAGTGDPLAPLPEAGTGR